MANNKLVNGLTLSDTSLTRKCVDCIQGRQTWRPFDRETEKNLGPPDLVSFDLWGPSRVRSAGRKIFLMVIVDAGTAYKHGAFLVDKSDAVTLDAFETFLNKAEITTNRKIQHLQTDGAFNSGVWVDFYKRRGITHEITAPYSSAQNGLAERALLCDSGLSHSYWAEAAAYSINTRNLIPSR